ncbi:MAG: ribosome small subunit-dependent GTPase A [Armatimonadota bacterium]
MPLGTVSVVYGPRCEVMDGGVALPCLLRGRLKLAAGSLAVGDRVEYRRVDECTGVVERVLERRNQLARPARERTRRRGAGPAPEQVVLANPDQVVFVAAARDPGIHFELMDRALALARASRLPAAICVNKIDLAPRGEIERLMRPYEQLGIPVVYTSAEQRSGLEALRPYLQDRLSFFWGGSGVGKSSLIRALTGEEVRVGRWRTDNPRGPHTTNVTRLYPLPFGGLIADTPGFDWLELDTVQEDEDTRVDALLPEAADHAPLCRFPACSHCGEPDCAVMAAVVAGEIDRGRYARFRAEMAETLPTPDLPLELYAEGDDLLFRMREGNSSLWTTFRFFHLFQRERPERAGLLGALGAPADGRDHYWAVFQEKWLGTESRSVLQAKLTWLSSAVSPPEPGEEVVLRDRGIVRGIGRVRELRPAAHPWRLRQPLKGTAIYEARAFWTDLKPPAGVELPEISGELLVLGSIDRFEVIPELGMGVLTRQEAGWVLDFLEVGSAEDALAHG